MWLKLARVDGSLSESIDGQLMNKIINSLPSRAKRHGVPCTLTEESLPPIPPTCPCCGITFDPQETNRQRRPSLDRIFPDKGYTPENVMWLCLRCNRLKSNASPEELVKIALFVTKIQATYSKAVVIEVPQRREEQRATLDQRFMSPAEERVRGMLSDDWQNIKELQAKFEANGEVAPARETISLALNRFLRDGEVVRQGNATRGVSWKKLTQR